MVLVIGSKAGSLLPGDPTITYTYVEYAEATARGMHVLPFVKVAKRGRGASRARWRSLEKDKSKSDALTRFRADVGRHWTWATFSTASELALLVVQSLHITAVVEIGERLGGAFVVLEPGRARVSKPLQ